MSFEDRKALLGSDYDPFAGKAALRLEAQFYAWVAAGRDPLAFANATPEDRKSAERETRG